MSKEYGELSTMFYELTKPVGFSIDGDIEYYAEKLKNLTGRVLEAGVGTGRMLIPLIKNGFIVDGVDNSSEMLGTCKANMKKHEVSANLYNQDLTRLSLPHTYDAIIMPTGSFCLLPKSKVNDILTGFYKSLNNGGRLVIDLEMMPARFSQGEIRKPPCGDFLDIKVNLLQVGITRFHHDNSYVIKMREISVSADTKISLTATSENVDLETQKVSYIHKYELIKNGKVTKTEISDFILYWYEVAEFEILLSHSGFVGIETETGYGKTGQSDVVTFTAFKKEK